MLTPISSPLRVACNTLALLFLIACSDSQPKTEEPNITEVRSMEHDELVQRGSYLVTAGHCNDCHTPKKMTPNGPVDDSSLTLAGHQANAPLPPVEEKYVKPGNWVLFSPT